MSTHTKTLSLIFVLVAVGLLFGMRYIKKNETTAPAQITRPSTSIHTQLAEVATSTTILVFGDSITAGYGISLPDAYPAQLERALLSRGYNVRVINAGVSGETTAGGLRRAEFASKQKPDIVLIVLGGNDVLRGVAPASTKENLELIIQTFQQAGSRVVLVGMYAPANLGDIYVKEFSEIYTSLAVQFDVPLVPFLLDGVALDKTLNQSDGIHPNQQGAKIIAEQNILPTLLRLL